MSGSKTVSLLLPPEPNAKSHDLQSQIQQVIAQKGSFRHVTEESLLAEIQGKVIADAEPENDPGADVENDGALGTAEAQQERLWKRRDEMMREVDRAQNEILSALDFVSLELSKLSAAAQSSMSPALKAAVPAGTWESHILTSKQPSDAVRKQQNLVSEGWRSASFESASEKLNTAMEQLQASAQRETKYWAQIAELKKRGWPVSRLPRDNKAIGVHFGFAESAPQFRDRAFALLRQSSDGDIILDSHSSLSSGKRLSVQLVRDGSLSGAFTLSPTCQEEDRDIVRQICDARDTLFEEELFYEISREARLISNQGISSKAQTINIELDNHSRLILAYVTILDKQSGPNPEDNAIAEFVALTARLLLTNAHEQSLERRSKPPPPMTLQPRAAPEYAILRPVLTNLRHRAQAVAFWNRCRAFVQPLKHAALPVVVAAEKSGTPIFNSLSFKSPSTILSELMVPAKTSFKLTLASGKTISLGMATFLGAPLFGTRYEISSVSLGSYELTVPVLEDQETALQWVRRILTADLAFYAQTVSLRLSLPDQQQWRLRHPQNGELCLHNKLGEVLLEIQISVLPQALTIKVKTRDKKGVVTKSGLWLWSSTSFSRTEQSDVTAEANLRFDTALSKIMSL